MVLGVEKGVAELPTPLLRGALLSASDALETEAGVVGGVEGKDGVLLVLLMSGVEGTGVTTGLELCACDGGV